MSDNNTEIVTAQPDRGKSKPRWGRRILVGALLVGLGTASGFAIGKVHGAPFWLLHGMGHNGFDAQRVASRVDRRVERVLSKVDASEEQKQRVGAIAKSAIGDLAALGVKPWEARGKLVALLRAEAIDPAALEALRAEQVGKIDAASRRAIQALTDAAMVLTPEQRRELTQRWHERVSR